MSTDTLIALVGNPNCGKSVLFNALTGQRQTIGNWSGVTVDKKQGICELPSDACSLLDLPGIHNKHSDNSQQAIDTCISCDVLATQAVTLCLNVVDACHLEKSLALTQQLRRSTTPMLLVVNKLDLAAKQGLTIDLEALCRELACPVIGINAKRSADIKRLRIAMADALHAPKQQTPKRTHSHALLAAEKQLSDLLCEQSAICGQQARDVAEQLLCDANTPRLTQPTHWREIAASICDTLNLTDPTTAYHQGDFKEAKRLASLAVTQRSGTHRLSSRLDAIVLHRWFGVPLFFLVMYLLFFFAINVGGAFQDACQQLSEALLVHLPAQWMASWHAPPWLIAIVANGIGRGIATTVTFIPVIAALFLFLSLLEETGYLARAAFVVDRLMQTLHLPGQAFIPMIIGFGCNVPAIMSTRSLNHTSDRIITALMAPFMSCGARLAIFAIVANAFFVHAGSAMVFLLYLIGLVVAVLTGLLTRRLLLHSYRSHWLVSLPDYQRPNLRAIAQRVKRRVSGFVKRAGKVIVPTCALIGALTQVNISLEHGIHRSTPDQSALAQVGRTMTPLFQPMGIQTDNWPATVGLATGIMAKEVVIATLNTLYQRNTPHHEQAIAWRQELIQAGESIRHNLSALPAALLNPVLASAADQSMEHAAYQHMKRAFAHPANAFCYLLFILLYFPCISTLAAMRQELGRWWGLFSISWSTLIAYIVATDAYQLLTWSTHPLFASLWLLGSGLLVSTALLVVHRHVDTLKTVVAAHTPVWKNTACSTHCSGCEDACSAKVTHDGRKDEEKPIV